MYGRDCPLLTFTYPGFEDVAQVAHTTPGFDMQFCSLSADRSRCLRQAICCQTGLPAVRLKAGHQAWNRDLSPNLKGRLYATFCRHWLFVWLRASALGWLKMEGGLEERVNTHLIGLFRMFAKTIEAL